MTADGASVDPQQTLKIDQVAALLQVSRKWLELKVAARELPHTRVGRQIRFTRDHIDWILAAGEQPVLAAPRRLRGVR